MATGIDFSDLGGQAVAAPSAPVPQPAQPAGSGLDFSDLGGQKVSAPPAPPAQPSVASRVASGVGQSLNNNVVKPVAAVAESVVSPPQDHKEAIAHIAAGTPGLQLYRLGKYLVDSVENTIDTGKEGYQKGLQDFARGVQEVSKGDLRGALASAGSTLGDVMNVTAPGTGVGSKVKELSEGTRPGGDLATPLARDVTDVGLMAAGEKAPEILEGAGKAAKAVAKKVGVGGLEPAESLRKAAGGSAGIAEKRFPENADRLKPYIAEEDKARPISGSPESLAEAAHNIKTNIWDKVTDQIKDLTSQEKIRYSTEHGTSTMQDAWVDGKGIAQDIKDNVSEFVRNHQGVIAKKIDRWADTFANAYPDGKYPLDKAAQAVSEMNAKLRDTYRMDPGSRAAMITRSPELGMYEDAADAIREKVDEKLTKWGHTDSAELRKDYGAAAQMERVFERRGITYGRQVPISLKQGLSYLAGAAGHPAAVAAALAEKYFNSPEYLIKNYVKGAKPPSAPIAVPAIQKAAPVGVGVGSQTPTKTEPDWVKFKGGDGKDYEHHPDESWEEIKKRDPGATK